MLRTSCSAPLSRAKSWTQRETCWATLRRSTSATNALIATKSCAGSSKKVLGVRWPTLCAIWNTRHEVHGDLVGEAEARLASAWLRAIDRKAISDAADKLDSQLRNNAHLVGESRESDRRIIHVSPIGAVFAVDMAD